MSEVNGMEELRLPLVRGEVERIKEAKITKDVYPILQLNAKSWRIAGFGKLVSINGQNAIESLIWLDDPDESFEPNFPRTVILTGGLYPQLFFVRHVAWADNTEETEKFLIYEGMYAKFPGSFNRKCYIAIGSEPEEPEFTELQENAVVHRPPYVWLVNYQERIIECLKGADP